MSARTFWCDNSNVTHTARWCYSSFLAVFPTQRPRCDIFRLWIIIEEYDSLLQTLPLTALGNRSKKVSTLMKIYNVLTWSLCVLYQSIKILWSEFSLESTFCSGVRRRFLSGWKSSSSSGTILKEARNFWDRREARECFLDWVPSDEESENSKDIA